MAQQVVVQLIDDLDGSKASTTVEFVLDGKAYEIDLSDDNAARLRASLAPFVEAARRPRGRQRQPRASGRQQRAQPASSDREYSHTVRQWARVSGWAIADRGRIPANVIDAYEHRNAE